jgi:hypothetical protein
VPPLSHLTSFMHSKSNLYIDMSFASVMSNLPYTDFLRSLPNLMSSFLNLGGLSKESVQVWRPLWHFVTSLFSTVRSC